jgi:hypothetical protein
MRRFAVVTTIEVNCRVALAHVARWHALTATEPLTAFASSPRLKEINTMADANYQGSTEHDFDFLFGSWRVLHRRLRLRLAGNDEWEEFDGTCAVQPLLGGAANIDDNVLNLPAGVYRAASLRAYDLQTRRWAIWWLDARSPLAMDPPVLGGFDEGTGTFYADDLLDGKPIRVRFRWTGTHTSTPVWEQAFSPDAGTTWETNWTMKFVRMVEVR